ncbi:MAG: DUF3604 domain-containing protein [Opitutaceae bacterium]|nr:DUF3604 domain-containing protein [Opitutaceae bacterium]
MPRTTPGRPRIDAKFPRDHRTLLLACAALRAAIPAAAHPQPARQEEPPPTQTNFVYDPAAEMVAGEAFGTPLGYEAHVASWQGALWSTWLEFTPGKGDRIHIGTRGGGGRPWTSRPINAPGTYAEPTLTLDARDRLWLSYEAETGGQWDVWIVRLQDGVPVGEPQRVSAGKGADINHCVAAAPSQGLWIAWQSDQQGQFDVLARRVSDEGMGEVATVSPHPRGDWQPSVVVAANGVVHVGWDAYDGESFNVHLRSLDDGRWGPVRDVARSPAFEGRVQLAADQLNRVWIAWEEGERNWGAPFRGNHKPENLSDERGPLHRFRALRLAVLDEQGTVRSGREPLPMPARAKAAAREPQSNRVQHTGVFYERARLAIDGAGRPWIAYRHYYTPWLGIEQRSHVEAGWGVYARCLSAEGWSPLYRLAPSQGDGLQRLEVTAHADGIAAVWTAGRTDRVQNQRPRGSFAAVLHGHGDAPRDVSMTESAGDPMAPAVARRPRPEPAVVGGRQYQLFYGDLHRHTDISLCLVTVDGTLDDAYRYAIEVAGLDFLGITDHARDIAQGDALGHLWWRNRKEVFRHQLGTTFFPFVAFEASRTVTADHNVISLKGDMLRPDVLPIPDLWKELDDDTLTIPHQPIRRQTWQYQDDKRRPLVEVFQGFRDVSIEDNVNQALGKGYHLGFIASSDHMSTSASYACVWSEDASREAIFRSLQARRTYGATTNIRLVVRAGDHWMGERITATTMPVLEFDARGTAPIATVELVVDGKLHQTFSPGERDVRIRERPALTGSHYIYFRLQQTDGNRAWSSPLWIDIRPAAPH